MTVTTRLSEYIKNLTYKEIPPEVIAAAKDCILDTLGSAIGGAGSPDVQGIVGELEKYDGQKDCTLWALENRASVLNAVLINGTLAHTTEMDDVHKRSKSSDYPS
jgi:2-methylcitrate dehydratase PrpD